jgi:hypothetical protein
VEAAPPGSVQVPPACGEPPRDVKRSFGASLLQSVMLLSVPGTGGVFTATVTVALSLGQGAIPATVYVYNPGVPVAGSNVPVEAAPPGSVQVPPACGEPPRLLKRSVAASVLQSVMLPSVPGTGGVFTATVTVALSLGHGAVPATV